MMKHEKLTPTLAVLALLGVAVAARADQTVKARLHGFNEVPAISSTGSGEFRARILDEDTVEFHLSYEGLEGTTTTAAHIHLGQAGVNGGVSVFFCGGGGRPACTPGSGTFEGTFTASDVIGPITQGIDPGELSELIAAIRTGKTYVNVHTNKHPGGEIRGQVREDSGH
jgi:hypothetical protein